MKDLARMRLDLLVEIKQIIRFFEKMERDVKSRNPAAIYPAYTFIKTIAYHVKEGDLSPLSLSLHQALLHNEYLDSQDELINGM